MRKALSTLLALSLGTLVSCDPIPATLTNLQQQFEGAANACVVEGPEGSGRVLVLQYVPIATDNVTLTIYESTNIIGAGGRICFTVPGKPVAIGKCVSDTTASGISRIAVATDDGQVHLINIESGVDSTLGPSGVEMIRGIEFVAGSVPGRKNIVVYGDKGGATDAVGVFIDNGDGSYLNGEFQSGLASVTGMKGLDLDGDGDEDLAFTSPTGPNALRTAFYDADLAYAAAFAYTVADSAAGLGSADLDGDGRKDLVVFSDVPLSIGQATVFKNMGDGTVSQTHTQPVGSGPTHIAFGDVNLDGHPDAVVANGNDDTVSLLFGITGAAFGAASTHVVPDGVADMLLTSVGPPGLSAPYPHVDLVVYSTFENVAVVLLGDGTDLVSEQVVKVPAANEVLDFVLADFDNSGDGVLEAAALMVPTDTGSFPYDLYTVPWDAGAQTWGTPGPPDDSANLFGKLVTADFDGVNGPDLAGGILSGGVGVLLNDGSGGLGLAPLTIDTAGRQVQAIEVANINTQETVDQHPDAIILVDNELRTWFGQGDGTFTAGPTTAAIGRSMAMAIDPNGSIRLCVAHPAIDSATFWLVNTDGTFTQTDTVSTAPLGNISSITAGDFNADGLPDFVAVSSDDPQVDVRVLLFERQASPGDYSAQTLFTGARSEGWALLDAVIADLDGNGQADVVAVNNGFDPAEQFVAQLPGITAGMSVLPVESYLSGEPSGRIAVADLGGDGGTWVVTGKAGLATGLSALPVRINRFVEACVGDIADDFGNPGGDGMVSFGDFLALLGLIGPCPGGTPGCTGDIADDFGTLNGGDGMVSFGDFLALLGLIGPCP